MAVDDLWRLRDGTPSKRDGRGRRWRVRVDGYPSTLHRTKAEAQAVELDRLRAGPPTKRDDATVGGLLNTWLAGKAALSPKGLEAAKLAAAYVRERWADVKVDDVTATDVQVWVVSLSTPKGPASVSLRHKVLQCMRGALRGRVDLGSVRVPREQKREPIFLTAAQLAKLAGAARRNGPMIWLLGTTGLRIGEACALNVGDVSAKRGRLRVGRAKSGRGRDVPIAPKVLAMLDLDREPDAPLFTTSRGGRVDKNHWRQRHWVPARDALGVPGLRVHDLRHTAASLAIASGADVKAVQRMLGHASAAMTLDVYGHLFDRALDDVAARLDRLLS